MKKEKIKPTIRIGRDISVKEFIRSRFVTPREIINGMKDPAVPNRSIGAILFNARYKALKAIEGYDFF